MKLYIAGPMRGYYNFNFITFDDVAAALYERGEEPINPAAHDREVYPDIETWEGFKDGDIAKCPKFSLADALRWDLEQVVKADGIVLLPGWEKSSGANHERYMAEVTGRKILLAVHGRSAGEWVFVHDPEQIRVSNKPVAPVAEVRVTDPKTGGQKCAKLAKFCMIPPEVLLELAEHYGKGEQKYPSVKPGLANWQQGYRYSLSGDALARHLCAWLSGEEFDAETGSHHLVAVMWHAAALRFFTKHGLGTDDRYCTVIKEASNGLPKMQNG